MSPLSLHPQALSSPTLPQVITRESAAADKVKQVVSKEEAAASEEAAQVKTIKNECEADLAVALPLLEAALKVCVGRAFKRH